MDPEKRSQVGRFRTMNSKLQILQYGHSLGLSMIAVGRCNRWEFGISSWECTLAFLSEAANSKWAAMLLWVMAVKCRMKLSKYHKMMANVCPTSFPQTLSNTFLLLLIFQGDIHFAVHFKWLTQNIGKHFFILEKQIFPCVAYRKGILQKFLWERRNSDFSTNFLKSSFAYCF